VERPQSDDPFAALTARYDTAMDARGVSDWIAFVERVRAMLPLAEAREGRAEIAAAGTDFIDVLRRRARSLPRARGVFVSHQQGNLDWAERVAWEVTEVNLAYWLDAHDLGLAAATAASLSLA